MDLRDVARLRLRNQRVSGTKFKSAADVVGWLGCVQSQDYPLAKWTLGMRGSGFLDADVDAALLDGRILRTHILRPTWHFVLPADIRWMMALTGPRVARVIRTTTGIVVPPEAVIQRAFDAIRDALADRGRMTRVQIMSMLSESLGLTQPMSIPVLMRAELDLVLCSGGLVGRAQTYALVDERAPGPAGWVFDRDWALAELTRRFFTSHGPATIADFTWWSSLTVGDTKRGLEMNGSDMERVDVDGKAYWWAGEAGGSGTADSEPSPTVHLMQAYDEYVVAHRAPRDPINIERLVTPSVMSRPPFLHTIVLDTQAVGWWRRVTDGAGFAVETKLARGLTPLEDRALDAEIDRYAAFVGRPVSRLG